jgi:hypothetical protein
MRLKVVGLLSATATIMLTGIAPHSCPVRSMTMPVKPSRQVFFSRNASAAPGIGSDDIRHDLLLNRGRCRQRDVSEFCVAPHVHVLQQAVKMSTALYPGSDAAGKIKILQR